MKNQRQNQTKAGPPRSPTKSTFSSTDRHRQNRTKPAFMYFIHNTWRAVKSPPLPRKFKVPADAETFYFWNLPHFTVRFLPFCFCIVLRPSLSAVKPDDKSPIKCYDIKKIHTKQEGDELGKSDKDGS